MMMMMTMRRRKKIIMGDSDRSGETVMVTAMLTVIMDTIQS